MFKLMGKVKGNKGNFRCTNDPYMDLCFLLSVDSFQNKGLSISGIPSEDILDNDNGY